MKRLFVGTFIFLLLAFGSAKATTANLVGGELAYTAESISQNTGRLILIVCPGVANKHCQSDISIGAAGFNIEVNGQLITKLSYSQYLDVLLPRGRYAINIKSFDLFGFEIKVIGASFDILVKDGHAIAVLSEAKSWNNMNAQIFDNSIISIAGAKDIFEASLNNTIRPNWKKAEINELQLMALLATPSTAVDNEIKSEISQAQYLQNLNSYRDIDLKREADDAIVKDAAKQEEANLRQAKESMRQQEAKIAEEKRQKESDMLEAKRQREVEDALVKKDDATCKSYGGKKGTQAYIQCRVSLVASRQEAADRQKTMDALEKKIETLQSQIQSQAVAQSQAQERDRRLSAEQYASEQEFKNKQIELQQAQLRTLQQEAQSAREARKWQNIQKSLDAMGTVTPAAPSPFSSYRIDGRTYRCTDIGGQVNCR